jgi:hypothetical protein
MSEAKPVKLFRIKGRPEEKYGAIENVGARPSNYEPVAEFDAHEEARKWIETQPTRFRFTIREELTGGGKTGGE